MPWLLNIEIQECARGGQFVVIQETISVKGKDSEHKMCNFRDICM